MKRSILHPLSITLLALLLIVPSGDLAGQAVRPNTITQYITPSAVSDTARLYHDLLNAIEAELAELPLQALRVRIIILDEASGEWKGTLITLKPAGLLGNIPWVRRRDIDAFVNQALDALDDALGTSSASVSNIQKTP